MPSYRRGRVGRITEERAGLQRVLVHDETAGSGAIGEPAYVLTALTGTVAEGDEVLYNATAVELGLGTGGWHVVHANVTRGAWSAPGRGHVLKLRYTSVQVDTGVAEEHEGATEGTEEHEGATEGTEEHEGATEGTEGTEGTDAAFLVDTLAGTPVVACTLHSQVGVVAVAALARRPGTRVVYVMTDGGALPLALSDLVADLRARDLVHATVTAGHAFGGDLEAVGVPSALRLARSELGADLVIVGMGPGVVGTDSVLGTSALEAAPILDTVAALGGSPVLCVRASSADVRPRHRGVSHHSLTVLDLVRSSVDVPLPAELAGVVGRAGHRHRVHEVEPPDVAALLAHADLTVTTMGRTVADDPAFFRAAAAAGTHAATHLPPNVL